MHPLKMPRSRPIDFCPNILLDPSQGGSVGLVYQSLERRKSARCVKLGWGEFQTNELVFGKAGADIGLTKLLKGVFR